MEKQIIDTKNELKEKDKKIKKIKAQLRGAEF